MKWNSVEVGRTKIIKKSQNPKWDNDIVIYMEPNNPVESYSLTFEVYDSVVDNETDIIANIRGQFLGCSAIKGPNLSKFLSKNEKLPLKLQLEVSTHFSDKDNDKVGGVIEVSGSIIEIKIDETNDGNVSDKKFLRKYVLNAAKLKRSAEAMRQYKIKEGGDKSIAGNAIFVLEHLCVHMFTYTFMYIFICMCIYTFVCICIRICIGMCQYRSIEGANKSIVGDTIDTHVDVYECMYMQIYVHECMHVQINQ